MAEPVDADYERVALLGGGEHSLGQCRSRLGSDFGDLFDPPVVFYRP